MYKKILFVTLLLCLLNACGEAQSARKTEIYEVAFEGPGGDILTYYLCETTYSGKEPTSFDTVDTMAVQSIFAPDCNAPVKTLEVCGYPCGVYLEDNRAYFCCTISAKSTVVLEYSPDVISEETATKIIRSIFEPVK